MVFAKAAAKEGLPLGARRASRSRVAQLRKMLCVQAKRFLAAPTAEPPGPGAWWFTYPNRGAGEKRPPLPARTADEAYLYACPLVHALRRHGEEERENLLLSILSEAVASGHWTSESWMLLETGEGDRSAAAHAFWGLLRRWCNLESCRVEFCRATTHTRRCRLEERFLSSEV
mmetsp:Transcript_22729/g.66877  ORF Transcript_22729/g.66877 Transcript_22729/m.66877 type:complete len:173 (+) Transcript_22729:1320-1838(+)